MDSTTEVGTQQQLVGDTGATSSPAEGSGKIDISQVEVVSNGQTVDITKDEDNKGTEETAPQETPKETEGTPQADSTTPNEITDKEIQETRDAIDNAKATLESKGLDYGKMEAEYNQSGKLSEESYKALKEAGYDKEIVDAVLAGWQAKADNFYNAVINVAGGEDAYKGLTQFVSSQGQAAVDAFNEVVSNANLNTITSYLAGVKAQMTAKYGTANPTLTGGGVVNKTPGFQDQNEMIRAMQDKRYGRDAAYTKEVEKKLAVSKLFGD